jgi:Uri superfamily endonuclease
MNDIATPTATTDPRQAPQTYQLLIEVAAPVRVCIGRFGTFDFPAGRYCYTGSAKRNFEARVRRHQSTIKALRWHIDYLLAAPGVQIVEVLRHTRPECQVNQAKVGEVLVNGFGASDCHAGCGSHLKKLR